MTAVLWVIAVLLVINILLTLACWQSINRLLTKKGD